MPRLDSAWIRESIALLLHFSRFLLRYRYTSLGPAKVALGSRVRGKGGRRATPSTSGTTRGRSQSARREGMGEHEARRGWAITTDTTGTKDGAGVARAGLDGRRGRSRSARRGTRGRTKEDGGQSQRPQRAQRGARAWPARVWMDGEGGTADCADCGRLGVGYRRQDCQEEGARLPPHPGLAADRPRLSG